MPKPIYRSLAPTLFLVAVCSSAALVRPSAANADSLPLTPDKPVPLSATCPTDIPGTSIIATPIDDGVDLIFLAPHHAADMRRRVRALSLEQSHSLAPRPGETAAQRRAPVASVYDIEGGAILKLTARNLEQLADVQEHAVEYAQRLAGDNCSLLRDVPTPDTRKPTAPASVQMPPGIVPGIGGVTTAPILIPSLGVF